MFNRNIRFQNLFIVVVSYIFYGWWDWRFLLLIAFTSIGSYSTGILIERYRKHPRKAKIINVLNIVVNLLILGVFKYYDFFVTSFADLFLRGRTDGLLLEVILPVGISFYTFQALSYSIDVYRGNIEPTRDVIQFFAYVSFFPQLVAGPIERATNLLPQFAKPRKFEYETGVDGMRQILWGLFKKMVVADNCAIYVDQVFSSYQNQSGSTLLLAAVLFAFQIYGDFSGYSDIAIGTAKLFGIKLMRNFNVPYFSRDIAEFWRRWHISLTTWFRDYVYIPLGGSRCSKVKIVRNTFVIFLLSGFWHGANWTFIAWGAYHALLFLPLILLGKNRKYRDVIAERHFLPSWKELGQVLLTFFLVVMGWIIFRASSINEALSYLGRMVDYSLISVPWLMQRDFYVPLFISILVTIAVEWTDRKQNHGLSMNYVRSRFLRQLIYLVISIIIAVQDTGTGNQFIYFQF